MKIQFSLAIVVILFGAVCVSHATAKPVFTGKWKLDKDRSFSNPPGLDQTMTITHAGDQIKLEAHLKTARGEQDVNETYTLDGKEAEFKPAAPPNATGKRKASWLPNGQSVLIVDEVSVDGKIVSTVSRKWTLSADGNTLTVDYFIDDQRGSFESKRVFVKTT